MENIGGIWGAVIGAIVTLGGAYIANVWTKKTEADKEIKIAEINADSEEYEKTKAELMHALEAIKDLNEELHKEKEIRLNIEHKFEAVKLAFKIIFNQYAKQFKEDPEQLDMLEELRKILNE